MFIIVYQTYPNTMSLGKHHLKTVTENHVYNYFGFRSSYTLCNFYQYDIIR